MKNLGKLTENEIKNILENGKYFEIIEKHFGEIEEKSYEKFNEENFEFTEDENLEFFYEKRKSSKSFFITKDGLEEFFRSKIGRKALKGEKEFLINRDENLREIKYKED